MGNLVPAKRTLRALGALGNLDGKGMIRKTVTTKKDSTSKSWVYEVAKHRLKLLLRDKDVEIILFSAEGRKPTKKERNGHFLVEKTWFLVIWRFQRGNFSKHGPSGPMLSLS